MGRGEEMRRGEEVKRATMSGQEKIRSILDYQQICPDPSCFE